MANMSADFYAIFPRLRVQIPLATCGPQYCAQPFGRDIYALPFGAVIWLCWLISCRA